MRLRLKAQTKSAFIARRRGDDLATPPTSANMADIDIFIGEPLAHGSDRTVLLRAVAELTLQSVPAVILANVQINGRQIDLIAATEHRTLVVEAKGWRGAVRGSENGTWQIQTASGGWKDTANAYQQTLAAKNALRDAMTPFSGTPPQYPDAALIFCPADRPGLPYRAAITRLQLATLTSLRHSSARTADKTGLWNAGDHLHIICG